MAVNKNFKYFVCKLLYICVLIIIVGLLHGDINQAERNEIISAFKKKEFPILVATDVAGKRLISGCTVDFYHISTSIALSCQTHQSNFSQIPLSTPFSSLHLMKGSPQNCQLRSSRCHKLKMSES